MNNQLVFRFLARGLVAVALCNCVLAADPLMTNTTNFRIPFDIESPDGGIPDGAAILFSSVNGGPFAQVQRVDASTRGFQFAAPADGRYGFAVRMTDAAGRVAGETAPLEAELEVIVDTISPKLQIVLSETGSGMIDVAWSSDSAVAPGSVRLEFAEGADGRWLPIESATEASGTAALKTSPGTSVSVRGLLSDLAGNEGAGSAQMISSARPVSPSTNVTYPNAPGTATGSSLNDSGTGNQQSGAVMGPNPFYIPPQSDSQRPMQVSTAGPMLSEPAQVSNLPAPGPTQRAPFSDPVTYQGSPGLTAGTQYPPSSGAQLVKSHMFDIAYQLEDVGPSGVGAVELFVTENGGQQWFRYGKDIDLRTPFQVDARGEGTFGFAVRVVNGLGFSDAPPQPGEMPTIVVTVDQTPPVIRLGTPQVVATGAGYVSLNWQLSENNPAPNPVRLEYASSPAGPWTPLFDWQSDQRGFQMPIQTGVSAGLYFRLLARDAAGNVATAQTPQAVIIDQQRPHARLLRVEPATFQQSF